MELTGKMVLKDFDYTGKGPDAKRFYQPSYFIRVLG